jgi:hypothetical protein
VVGGPGAWQLEKANRLDEFKIDYLIDGEIERVFQRSLHADHARRSIVAANHQGPEGDAGNG